MKRWNAARASANVSLAYPLVSEGQGQGQGNEGAATEQARIISAPEGTKDETTLRTQVTVIRDSHARPEAIITVIETALEQIGCTDV